MTHTEKAVQYSKYKKLRNKVNSKLRKDNTRYKSGERFENSNDEMKCGRLLMTFQIPNQTKKLHY
jgi:hypothetical protein